MNVVEPNATQTPHLASGIWVPMRQAFAGFQRHRATSLAAGVAYFAIFAVAPLIIVVVEIAGVALGSHRRLLDEIYADLVQTVGREP